MVVLFNFFFLYYIRHYAIQDFLLKCLIIVYQLDAMLKDVYKIVYSKI